MNQDKIFIKPTKPAILVRHISRAGHLNVHGEYVKPHSHWIRRMRDGDVIQLTEESDIKKAIAAGNKAEKAAAAELAATTTKES